MVATEPQPRAAAPTTGWDTELLVLRGSDRADLRARAFALAARIERQPDGPLVGVAAALARELQPGGSRLAIVASSPADLLARLNRAADRLGDPKCKQIRDANGIYYFEQPLAEQGTVALLFPGEGAQYLNMLADLCGVFPEVEETFAWCDRLAAEAGRPEESLRRVLHLPPDATADEKAAAEADLRGLGPSIFGVLLADQAIFRVLEHLQVPVSAMAGHSAGELGALVASGVMNSQREHGGRLPEIMDIMQRQESAVGGPEVVLLAVGAGKATVTEVAGAVAGGGVTVAMDNCPHQCVAVGPAHLVAAVEAALTERGIICERLPFKRPYHTPLFEPYMGALRELFVNVPFNPTRTAVYCCSTGALFPPDPDAIRQLAVNHWVSPVEFTRMIETMHADGVRLFVECGPRGNLSAFVEDILRGKPFAAIPANVFRKSGPTQINHMVAQLVAHGIDLNLGHLYAGRVGEAPPPEGKGAEDRPTPNPSLQGGESDRGTALGATFAARDGSFSPSLQGGGRGVGWLSDSPVRDRSSAGEGGLPAVMHGYLDAMEQFLDTQRAVMSAYLGGHPAPAEQFAFPGADALLVTERSAPPPAHCLVGEVVRHEPGREIVFRRVMDEREDLYADDHTLGGRGVSREDPTQNGLPVLPMTFSLEAMAEAAALLAPGKVVIAIRNVRLFRWLPFDPDPTTLEVRAEVSAVAAGTGVIEVKATVRDLGNSFLPDGANRPSAEATVVLADHYPEPPAPLPFELTDEVPCKSAVEDLRRNMFHGPLFQMIRSLDRTGREGIEGTLEVQPRDRWFRSNPNPHSEIDPVLTDAAMHILGAWHLEQPDWSGRILLPIGVRELEFFGPPLDVGARVLLRGHNEEETARQVSHGVELFDTAGRVRLRLTGAGYWRFYLPFGDVNFFGPKDQYFLSARVPGAEPIGAPAGCQFLDPPLDLQQPVLRASGVRVTMTPRENAEFIAWSGSDAARSDWFFGRLVAKDAVRAAWFARHQEGIFPADIETEDVDGRIVCRPRGAAKVEPLPPVSVAICEGKVAAFCAFAERVGVALQTIARGAPAEVEREARAAVARRAGADALRVPVEGCALETLDADTGAAVVSANGLRFRVQTARQKEVIVATTCCEPE